MFCQTRLASPPKPELSNSFWRISISGLDAQDWFAGGDFVADGCVNRRDATGARGLHVVLGFHRLDGGNDLALGDGVADFDIDLDQLDVAIERREHIGRLAATRLRLASAGAAADAGGSMITS